MQFNMYMLLYAKHVYLEQKRGKQHLPYILKSINPHTPWSRELSHPQRPQRFARLRSQSLWSLRKPAFRALVEMVTT